MRSYVTLLKSISLKRLFFSIRRNFEKSLALKRTCYRQVLLFNQFGCQIFNFRLPNVSAMFIHRSQLKMLQKLAK